MSDRDDSSIEHVKEDLYKRGVVHEERHRRTLHEVEHEEVQSSWDAPKTEEEVAHEHDPQYILDELHKGHVPGMEESEPEIFNDPHFEQGQHEYEEKKSFASRIIKGIFAISFVFFIFAAGIAGVVYYRGGNQVSCDNVSISITGPQSIASGKNLSLDINVDNSNPVPMRNTELEVVFPDGTRDAEYPSLRLPSTKLEVGTIEVGERVRSTVHALLFGQEMTKQQVNAKVTYEIDDSNASFTCEQAYEVTIATAPITLSVTGLEEISSGQEVELKVTVTSNSEEVVPDQRIVVDYPFGFDFVSSEPEPTTGDNAWDLGDLAPGAQRILTFKGVVRGQGTEAKAISVEVGEKDPANVDKLTTVLQKVSHPILVTKPFLALDIDINGDSSSEVVGQLGGMISGKITWQNTTEDALHDVEIDLKLDGVMLDESTVTGERAYYRSVDDTIIWTPQTTNGKLNAIEPGESGVFSFSFLTEKFDYRTSATNPSFNLEIEATARRISDSVEVPQSLTGQAKRIIRFDTDPTFNTYAVYNIGPLNNTGPHPPVVDTETTYTIVWSISNTTNDLRSTEVRGVLPEYVQWLGVYSPNDATVTYNPVTREVIWSPDGIARGAGYESPSKELYFQVSAIPSISQVSRLLTLIITPTLQGVDSFTGSVIERKEYLTDTQLLNDPYFKKVDGSVQK